VITLKMKNANSLVNKENLVITYTLPLSMLIMKPVFLSGVIFMLLVFVLISSRVNFSLIDEKKT